MRLSNLCVKRPLTTLMMMLLVVLLGLISTSKLPIDLFPDIEKPYLVVETKYDGASPSEVENLVTKPLEEALSSMKSLNTIESSSLEGKSVVKMSFNFGVNMNFVALEAREKIDLVAWNLPNEASSPKVQKFNPNKKATMVIAIATRDVDEMKVFASKEIKPRLERINGVASAAVVGGRDQYISVVLKKEKLAGYKLDVSVISSALSNQNTNWPGGMVKNGDQELLVRTLGEFKSLQDIKDYPISVGQGVIPLKELADVTFKYKDSDSYVRSNGLEAINIEVKKQSGVNAVQVGRDLNKVVEEIKSQYPSLDIHVIFDQSKEINKLIKNIMVTVVLGGILAIVVLYLFLRNIKTTMIIGLSLPVSVIATFALLYFNKITINMMTLGGLALGGGMLVDNSIVVLENIFRFRKNGHSMKEAAILGTEEVALSVTASTMTTIAVFIPVIFLQGMIASLFKTLALTVIFSLVSSLLVAITVIPMLSSRLLTDKDIVEKKDSKFTGFYKKFSDHYRDRLAWSLKNRGKVIVFGILVFVGSLVSIIFLDVGLFPVVDEGQFTVKVQLPRGTDVDKTLESMKLVESQITSLASVEDVHSLVGKNRSDNKMLSHVGEILVRLKPENQRPSTDQVISQVRTLMKNMPGLTYNLVVESVTDVLNEQTKPVEINLYGQDLNDLRVTSQRVEEVLSSIKGITDLETSMSLGKPEIEVHLDEIQVAKYGLSPVSISSQLKNKLTGLSETKLAMKGREYDIRVKSQTQIDDISDVEAIKLYDKDFVAIALSNVADVKKNRSVTSIDRNKQKRLVKITAGLDNVYYADILEELEEKMAGIDLLDNQFYKFGGQNEKMKSHMTDLILALVIAVVLVYMILASQFESLLNPFIIIISVPIAFGGGILGLLVFGQTLSIPAVIGAIVMSGVVVNDSILLIDYISQLRKEGLSRKEAILKAGPIRLQPILMTTLTTIFGLLPMLVSAKAATLSPMAAVVVGGLILADVLILLIIPVLYTYFDDIKIKLTRRD